MMIHSMLKSAAKYLRKDEQLALFEDFQPLRNALIVAANLNVKEEEKSMQTTLDVGIAKTSKKHASPFAGSYKMLSLKQAFDKLPKTKELIKARRAQEKLIQTNQPLALSMAYKFVKVYNYPKQWGEDLYQAGLVGLTYALYLYDPAQGGSQKIKFSSYAHSWVKALILEELQKLREIKVPTGTKAYPFRFYSQVMDASGDTISIYDTLVYDNHLSLEQELMDTLTMQEKQALTMPPMEAAMTIGISIAEVESIKKQAREKVCG